MASSNQMATALLTEHFLYTPLTLLDDIINIVNELAFQVINAIEEGLERHPAGLLGFRVENEPGMSEEARQAALLEVKKTEIDNGIVQLESLLNATIDKDFDKFEIYALRNILAVGHEEEELAGWVQLEHYKNLDFSSLERAPTAEQVQLQRRKMHETAKVNAVLKAEEVRNAAILSQLRSLVDSANSDALPFAVLSTSNTSTTQNLGQDVQYAITQLPALRQMISQLKDSLPTTLSARHTEEDEDSVEAKRRRYVESQAVRALKRKAVDREDPDVVAASTGRKIGRDEVEGMEAVVQALGGAEPVRRSNDEMEE